jgi:hypothetical protein
MTIDLDELPEGTWVNRKNDTVIIGAFLNDKLRENIFSWGIATAITAAGLYASITQMAAGEINRFLGGGVIIFCVFAFSFMTLRLLMSALGHLEFKLEEDHGTIFHGIRKYGRTHHFVYAKTTAIQSHEGASDHGHITQYGITIKEEKTLMFGGYMNTEKVNFIINMLHVFLQDGDQIRKILPPDLIHNLID